MHAFVFSYSSLTSIILGGVSRIHRNPTQMSDLGDPVAYRARVKMYKRRDLRAIDQIEESSLLDRWMLWMRG